MLDFNFQLNPGFICYPIQSCILNKLLSGAHEIYSRTAELGRRKSQDAMEHEDDDTDTFGEYSARRKEVFRSNVLKTIYPEAGKADLLSTSESDDDAGVSSSIPYLQPKITSTKLYTVAPPPEGFEFQSSSDLIQNEPQHNSESSGDSEEACSSLYRRKKRKRHGKTFYPKALARIQDSSRPSDALSTVNCSRTEINPSMEINQNADLKSTIEKQETLKLTKNQKRKMKKKRRKEKAMGEETISKNFTYDSIRHKELSDEKCREKMLAWQEKFKEFLTNLWEVYSSEAQLQSDLDIFSQLKEPLTRFLQSTNDDAVLSEHDVLYLDKIKTVLILKDGGRSKDIIDEWKQHSEMDKGLVHAICKLADYWLSAVVTS